ncbi:MAG TPA: (d)CMP kinase [Desulfotomaculum sp.]|jgi:cytidylate kinase|nr:(d)CMP kinase [Desulfotomaculum sp.]
MPFCIAIDGPAGAGKSTVAKLLAQQLGYLYVDTGAMYRAVTLKALLRGVDLADEGALSDLAVSTRIDLTTGSNEITRVFLEREDVTSAIRAPEVSRSVSIVARAPGVRAALVDRQKRLAGLCDVVMEGRDVGTVVAPEAQVKIFLTASVEERARRRQADSTARGYQVSLENTVEEIEERDRLDSSRLLAPLVPAPDARVIDCSRMNAQQVVELILELVRRSRG